MAISEQLLRIERSRLIGEGFDASDAFLIEYPAADRKRLKQLTPPAAALHHGHGTNRKLLHYTRTPDSSALDSSAPDDTR